MIKALLDSGTAEVEMSGSPTELLAEVTCFLHSTYQAFEKKAPVIAAMMKQNYCDPDFMRNMVFDRDEDASKSDCSLASLAKKYQYTQ